MSGCESSAGLCTSSHPQTTFSVSLCGSSFPGAMTESRMNPQGCTSGKKHKGSERIRGEGREKDGVEDNGETRQVKEKYGVGRQSQYESESFYLIGMMQFKIVPIQS